MSIIILILLGKRRVVLVFSEQRIYSSGDISV